MKENSSERAGGVEATGDIKAFARRALEATGVGHWLYRIHEWNRSRGGERAPAADDNGLAIPPAYLLQLVSASVDWRFFLASGEKTARYFAEIVDAAGGDFAASARVLDFGCGCGRVTRHLPALTKAEIFGVDYNPRLVRWCADNLPGTFSQNRLQPPLSFDDAAFDVVYLVSVFTHLKIATQNEWLDEFARIVKPGGFVIVTFHDEDHPGLSQVTLTREALLSAGAVALNDKSEGANHCATFQTRAFLADQVGDRFEVVQISSSLDSPPGQATALLRRPG
ncbi:MAG: class I SAM-dependent methyltransferase [Pseudomonadota bacterium]